MGLQISDAPQRGLPAFLQLRGNEAIVRIAGCVATLGQACLVAGLLHFQVPDTLLVFLLFPVHSLRLERGIDRHWFHRQQQLPADRGIDPRAAESHAARQAHHKVWLVAAIYRSGLRITGIGNAQPPPALPAAHDPR